MVMKLEPVAAAWLLLCGQAIAAGPGPAVVAPPDQAPLKLHQSLLDVTGIGGSTGAFKTLVGTSIVIDNGPNYNPSTGYYTVPFSGVYDVFTKLRVADNSAAGLSYGQGASTANVDGSFFTWCITVAASSAVTGSSSADGRNGCVNFREAHFKAGDQVRLFNYSDVALTITNFELAIHLVSPD